MAGKVEFDGDQFLLYKDQSTCTGGPEVVGQPTPSDNSGECDGESYSLMQLLYNFFSLLHNDLYLCVFICRCQLWMEKRYTTSS